MIIKEIFKLIPIFFGLNSSHREILLEEKYLLIRHLNFSYTDVNLLPVRIRKWFLDRLVKDFQNKNKEKDTSTESITENIKKIDMFNDFLQKKNSI